MDREAKTFGDGTPEAVRTAVNKGQTVVSEAAEYVQSGASRFADGMKEAAQATGEKVSQVSQSGATAANDLIRYVKSSPMTALLVTLGLGLFLGRAFFHRSS